MAKHAKYFSLGSALNTGVLQIQNGLPLDTTLRNVADQNNTVSPLRLSTNSVTNYGGGNLSTNTAFGTSALSNNTIGLDTTAIGYQALLLSNADYNTAIGSNSLSDNTIGTENVAVGDYAVRQNTTGSQNTGVGSSALSANQAGLGNTAIGALAMWSAVNGNYNTMVGYVAGSLITSSDNIGIGYNVFGAFTGGTGKNIAIGNNALAGMSSATAGTNIVIGYDALKNGVRVGSNVVIGNQAMQLPAANNCVGNVVVGANAEVPNNSSHSVVLGRAATATGSNQFVVGSTTYPSGAVASEVNSSTKVWNVIINGVAQKILLA